jgi:hypothetical protein
VAGTAAVPAPEAGSDDEDPSTRRVSRGREERLKKLDEAGQRRTPQPVAPRPPPALPSGEPAELAPEPEPDR